MRYLAWFSCGAASAVCAKLGIQKYGSNCIPIYCDTSKSEHSDNLRFKSDCERWIGSPITVIKSVRYTAVEEVFEHTRYMAGVNGARCTTELKKIPRLAYQQPDDVHLFGFTADEAAPFVDPVHDRIANFEANNPDILLEWILRDNGITKQACYQMLLKAGITLPELYLLGYPHNNCIGCVKATSPGYWNKIRRDFPEKFAIRASQSRELGVRLVRYLGERIFLDELPEGARGRWKDEKISCGPECGQV